MRTTFKISKDGKQWHNAIGMVDTGATYSQIPEFYCEKIGLDPHQHVTVITAEGDKNIVPLYSLYFKVSTDSASQHLMAQTNTDNMVRALAFGGQGDTVLLGADALVDLQFGVDLVNNRLIHTPKIGAQIPAVPHNPLKPIHPPDIPNPPEWKRTPEQESALKDSMDSLAKQVGEWSETDGTS